MQPGTRQRKRRDLAGLDAVESELTGRSSPIAEARRQLGKMPADERPSFGAKVNDVTEEGKIDHGHPPEPSCSVLEADRLLQGDKVDVTLEAWTLPPGPNT